MKSVLCRIKIAKGKNPEQGNCDWFSVFVSYQHGDTMFGAKTLKEALRKLETDLLFELE